MFVLFTMTKKFSFKILHKDKNCAARTGILSTRNGKIETPYFVPVSTSATVKGLDSKDLEMLGAQCTLSNTYHLHLQPGDKIIKKLGGLHKFMNFSKPIFTDSGGFQAFSLGLGKEHGVSKIGFFPKEKKALTGQKNLARVTDKGVYFKSIYDGSTQFIGPKESMKIQSNLDADIIMAFDECTSPFSNYEYTKKSMQRTHDWAKLSIKYHNKKQALYGIIQGGEYEDLRKESTQKILSMKFDGIAIGGSLGKNKEDMLRIMGWIIPYLDNRPRHMLGIGEIEDIFEFVERGMDTFDCVHATRIARRGHLFLRPKSGGNRKNNFRIRIKNAKHKTDKKPIDKNCNCHVCKNYSRAYLSHLFRANELSYYRLASIHNIYFMLELMNDVRSAIKKNEFMKLKRAWMK